MTIRGFVLVPIGLCPGDVNADGVVDIFDLLDVLASWGACPGDDPCWADISSQAETGVPNGAVDIFDLLFVLANWGACPGNPTQTSIPSRESQTTAVGITEERWDQFLYVLETGTESEQRRWVCWAQRRIMQCDRCPSCPGSDPFAN